MSARAATVVLLMSLAACGPEPIEDEPETARLEVLAAIDPDLSVPAAPIPARLLWRSTRAGTARFLSEGREVTETRVIVDGGEFAITELEPRRLSPGINDIEIYFVLRNQGSTTLEATVTILVDAECTSHDDCAGSSCEDFACLP